jgi:small-conductance mechanosensitive channel
MMMNERNRLLKPDQEEAAEAAWEAGTRGTSPRTQEAAKDRSEAEEALESAREKLTQIPLWGQLHVRALNEIDALERQLAEATRVWQVRYLESEERKEQIGKLIEETERKANENG